MKKILFISILVLCSVFHAPLSSIAQVPTYVPTSGLVGWWPFNGNANDESGNGNNGTVNGATLTSDRFGEVNKAYSFDGSNLVSNFITLSNFRPIFGGRRPEHGDRWFNDGVQLLRPNPLNLGQGTPQAVGIGRAPQTLQRSGMMPCFYYKLVY